MYGCVHSNHMCVCTRLESYSQKSEIDRYRKTIDIDAISRMKKSETSFGHIQVTVIASNMKKCLFLSLSYLWEKNGKKRQVKKAWVLFLSLEKVTTVWPFTMKNSITKHLSKPRLSLCPEWIRIITNWVEWRIKEEKNLFCTLSSSEFWPILDCFASVISHNRRILILSYKVSFHTIAVLYCNGMKSKIQCRRKADRRKRKSNRVIAMNRKRVRIS